MWVGLNQVKATRRLGAATTPKRVGPCCIDPKGKSGQRLLTILGLNAMEEIQVHRYFLSYAQQRATFSMSTQSSYYHPKLFWSR